jgi:Spy/CpxP family protein refolding chaperone
MRRNYSKKALLAALFAVGLALALLASQDAYARRGKGEKGPDPQRRIERMSVILDLTAEQEKAILPILEQEAGEIKAVRDKHRGKGPEARGEAREEIREIHDRYEALIEEELTAEQVKKYRELKALKRNRHRGGKGEGRGQKKGGECPPQTGSAVKPPGREAGLRESPPSAKACGGTPASRRF